MNNKVKEMELQTLKYKYALIYPLFAMGLVFGSCSQEDGDNILPEKNSQSKTITFTANPVNAETKSISTRVDLVPGASNRNDGLKWVDDEKISFKFIGEEYDDIKTYTVSVDNEGVASITGATPDNADDYKILALSPAKGTHFPAIGNTFLTIPDEFTQEENHRHLRDYTYMYAKPDGTVSVDGAKNATGGNIELNFNLLISLLRFEVSNGSSSYVTLKNIKVSFPSGESAQLISRAIFNDDGSLSPVGFHNDGMLLKFSDIQLSQYASELGYLSLFPTESASSLNIDLTVETFDGRTKTVEYEISNVPALKAANRYIVELNIDDTDLAESFSDRVGTDNLNGFDYVTYTFVTQDNTTVTWQVSPMMVTDSPLYLLGIGNDACPYPYSPPNKRDLENLHAELITYPSLVDLFLYHNFSPDTRERSTINDTSWSYYDTYFVVSNSYSSNLLGDTKPSIKLDNLDLGVTESQTNHFINGSRIWHYLVRCISK